MGEPWLDSLSEDWNSQPRTSSPVPSLSNSRHGTQQSRLSSSRIPHLAQSMRKASTGGSFLKPRSTRGIAKSKGIPILSERSASSLNLQGNQNLDGSLKHLPSSTFPRRTSSNFSDSQQSVQHHSINLTSKETPEWKKRLQNTEDIASDGFDLFSPSKLEGIFSLPAQPVPDEENQSPSFANATRPWSSLKPPTMQAPAEQFQSFRTSRSRAPPMEALLELSEEEERDELEHSMSAISSDLIRDGSMKGLVRRRVSDLESTRRLSLSPQRSRPDQDDLVDQRYRTLSGRQEMRNEDITPITASTKNTISEKAMRESFELNPDLLREKLMDADSERQQRPSSSSSDRDIMYDGTGHENRSMLHEASIQDLTSHSLPEDLSMGTQDFVARRGYINSRRGPASNETTFLKKRLSSLNESSQIEHRNRSTNFRSSPPPYNASRDNYHGHSQEQSSIFDSENECSVIHHQSSPQQPTSVGSPLKLFGNRDTYTNNKLLRVLSQFEQSSSDDSQLPDSILEKDELQPQSETALRMSQFGKGELDAYNFEKEVARPPLARSPSPINTEKIFQSFADLTVDDEGTIPAAVPPIDNIPEKEVEDAGGKRLPSSPAKERTSKRRRTLLREEITVDGVDIDIKVDHLQETSSVAGKKRKDAKPGQGGARADPDTLATRSILQPRAGSRKASDQSQNRSASQGSTLKGTIIPNELTEALAAELASFAQGVSDVQRDSRKPSLATKDYMEEANKVMEFIRARGKPTRQLSKIQEPSDMSELDADRILDLEVEDESTVEPFSRPPSREGPVKPREDHRIAKHDPRVASHLRKFKDSDDFELLASTSVVGTLHLVDNQAAAEAALVPVPIEEQESSPPNIRILNDEDTQRKRKHSASTTIDHVETAQSSDSSTRRTFATDSSNSSGQKGMITSGTVSIPDKVGTMTFDHEKQIWIKQQLIKMKRQHSQSHEHHSGKGDEATFDDDPFDSIPDLSIDEQHEAAMRVIPKSSSRSPAADSIAITKPSNQASNDHNVLQPCIDDNSDSELLDDQHESVQKAVGKDDSASLPRRNSSLQYEVAKHEERLQKGIASTVPDMTPSMQPRVVTISFSTPVATDIPQRVVDVPEPVSDDDEFLPPDDSDDDNDFLRTPNSNQASNDRNISSNHNYTSSTTKHQHYRSMTRDRRPVSRIDECDEDIEHREDMSLVRVASSLLTTPSSTAQVATTKPVSAYKGSSILCLTPLSEFTMHQADKAKHPEESFVQERAHPKALLQAHGALALSVDTLIKAITDAVPEEPFWEQLRQLDLRDSRLQSIHGLREYCTTLEMLDISCNQIAQLEGLPSTLRKLTISHNRINDLTSWSHLQNLQYVNVSNNQLENLEAFSSLVHMRRLRSRGNKIHDIEGILDLDGLLSLDLQDNCISQLDFEGTDLPRLEDLNLSNNRLTELRNLQCLPRLKRLDVSGNSLRELDVTEPLTSLECLKISRNELENLDLEMFPRLVKLELDDNCVKMIKGLQEASDLKTLSIRNQRNSPGIVDFVLTTQNECNEIFLSSNVLPHGQMQLPKYPHYNLRHLEMSACGLRALPQGFGDYFPNCRNLNLNFNAISELSPLLGTIKLRKLLFAGNRVKRLRRTCLVLTRLSALEIVDMRNNPLTVGFYSPEYNGQTDDEEYTMTKASATKDVRWLELMDETTRLKRKMIALLLREGCQSLKELDGLSFGKEPVGEHDAVWESLTSNGVFVKTIEAPRGKNEVPSAIEMPVDDISRRDRPPFGIDDNDTDMHVLAQERSLTVE